MKTGIKNRFKIVKILIVEDDLDDYILVKEYLEEDNENYSFDIHHACSGDIAIQAMQDNEYDMCLFDYRLGAIDGLELLSHVRREGYKRPIVFLTGQADKSLFSKALRAGASEYISKTNLSSALINKRVNAIIASYLAKTEYKSEYLGKN